METAACTSSIKIVGAQRDIKHWVQRVALSVPAEAITLVYCLIIDAKTRDKTAAERDETGDDFCIDSVHLQLDGTHKHLTKANVEWRSHANKTY